MGASFDPQRPPGRSEFRAPEQSVDDREIEIVEDDEALEGDVPVLEAVDTSAVTRNSHGNARATDTADVDPLFGQDAAGNFRGRWNEIQSSFVDDPQQAVRDGDELVTQVIDSLRQTFSEQRAGFETDNDSDSTESLRLALRRYRSFCERLLTI